MNNIFQLSESDTEKLKSLLASMATYPKNKPLESDTSCKQCSGTCKGSCQSACKDSCESGCEGACAGTCGGDCASIFN